MLMPLRATDDYSCLFLDVDALRAIYDFSCLLLWMLMPYGQPMILPVFFY
jgi:hypothetical protein